MEPPGKPGGFATGLLASPEAHNLVGRLAFDVGQVSPRLPPFIAGEGSVPGSLSVVAANVRLGSWPEDGVARDVMSHFVVDARITASGDHVTLTGVVGDLRANCAERIAEGWRLTPCLGDLVPVARMEFGSAPQSIAFDLGGSLRRLQAGTFGGLRVDAGDFDLHVVDGTVLAKARVSLGAGAQL